MDIRQAKIEDLDQVYAIEVANFSEAEAMPKTVLRDHIEKVKTSFLVAVEGDEVLGYLEGPVVATRHLQDESFEKVRDESGQDGGYISITSLSIAPQAQSLGLGRALMEAMKEVAQRDHRQGINLTCHDYLIAYYEKNGFVLEGRSKSTYAGEVWYDMVWDNPDF